MSLPGDKLKKKSGDPLEFFWSQIFSQEVRIMDGSNFQTNRGTFNGDNLIGMPSFRKF